MIDRRRRRVSRRRTGGEGCQGASGCGWIIAGASWEGKGEVAQEVDGGGLRTLAALALPLPFAH